MLEKFDAFQVATQFHHLCKAQRVAQHLKDQLLRASASVALNLAEGSGKNTAKEQRRFYTIAFGSFRECQAILLLERIDEPEINKLSGRLGAMLFKLSRKNV